MMKKWGFWPQNITQKPSSNFFPSRLGALVGLDQLKNVFRSIPPVGCYEILKISYLAEFSTNSLPDAFSQA